MTGRRGLRQGGRSESESCECFNGMDQKPFSKVLNEGPTVVPRQAALVAWAPGDFAGISRTRLAYALHHSPKEATIHVGELDLLGSECSGEVAAVSHELLASGLLC